MDYVNFRTWLMNKLRAGELQVVETAFDHLRFKDKHGEIFDIPYIIIIREGKLGCRIRYDMSTRNLGFNGPVTKEIEREIEKKLRRLKASLICGKRRAKKKETQETVKNIERKIDLINMLLSFFHKKV